MFRIQILADQLTLFQPGWEDYAHYITTGNPGFSDLPTALECFFEIKPPLSCSPDPTTSFENTNLNFRFYQSEQVF